MADARKETVKPQDWVMSKVTEQQVSAVREGMPCALPQNGGNLHSERTKGLALGRPVEGP